MPVSKTVLEGSSPSTPAKERKSHRRLFLFDLRKDENSEISDTRKLVFDGGTYAASGASRCPSTPAKERKSHRRLFLFDLRKDENSEISDTRKLVFDGGTYAASGASRCPSTLANAETHPTGVFFALIRRKDENCEV